jgi:hypothetical protein
MLKIKNKMAQEMKTAVLSVRSKKTLNCKIKTSPENGQLPLMPCWHVNTWKRFFQVA